jgi:hypothetical protein
MTAMHNRLCLSTKQLGHKVKYLAYTCNILPGVLVTFEINTAIYIIQNPHFFCGDLNQPINKK